MRTIARTPDRPSNSRPGSPLCWPGGSWARPSVWCRRARPRGLAARSGGEHAQAPPVIRAGETRLPINTRNIFAIPRLIPAELSHPPATMRPWSSGRWAKRWRGWRGRSTPWAPSTRRGPPTPSSPRPWWRSPPPGPASRAWRRRSSPPGTAARSGSTTGPARGRPGWPMPAASRSGGRGRGCASPGSSPSWERPSGPSSTARSAPLTRSASPRRPSARRRRSVATRRNCWATRGTCASPTSTGPSPTGNSSPTPMDPSATPRPTTTRGASTCPR